jgi:hypothetical protein
VSLFTSKFHDATWDCLRLEILESFVGTISSIARHCCWIRNWCWIRSVRVGTSRRVQSFARKMSVIRSRANPDYCRKEYSLQIEAVVLLTFVVSRPVQFTSLQFSSAEIWPHREQGRGVHINGGVTFPKSPWGIWIELAHCFSTRRSSTKSRLVTLVA